MNTATINTATIEPCISLIRSVDGRELPATGTWIVGRGQQVNLVRRGVRRRRTTATVLHGTLTVTDDPTRTTLDLTLSLLGGTEPVTICTAATPSIRLDYRGVFHHRGRVPSLWLGVSGRLPGSGAIEADLNLNPAD
jgi:hypothetical protein